MNSIIKLFKVSSNKSKGFFLIIATYFIFSIMELIAKDLGQRYDPLFIVFTRYVSQLIFLILLCITMGWTHGNEGYRIFLLMFWLLNLGL